MVSNAVVSAVFIAAVFVEFFFLVDFKTQPKKTALLALLALVACGLLALIPYHFGRHSSLGLYGLSWGISFCFVAPFLLRENMVPPLDERILLIVSATTLYVVLKHDVPIALQYAYAGGAVLAILNVLVPVKLGQALKIFFFAWYFVLLLTLPLMQLDFGSAVRLVVDPSLVAYPEAVALGTALCFVIVQYVCLFNLLPVPGRNETLDQAYARAKEYAWLLVRTYDDTQLPPVQAAVFILFLVILLGGNYYLGLVSDNTVLAVAVLASALIKRG